MKEARLADLTIILVIVGAGLLTAWVSFGILQSQATLKGTSYSVGGAAAAAFIAWTILTSLYLQVRKTSGLYEDLTRRNEELQQKLIRGAPRPLHFDTEVSERERIVLARPKTWEPRGGTIFDLEIPEKELAQTDVFPARFTCHFVPITEDVPSQEEWFKDETDYASSHALVSSFTQEIIRLGGEPRPVDSLKIIARQFARIELKQSAKTGKPERDWYPISKEEFHGHITGSVPEVVPAGSARFELAVFGGAFTRESKVALDGQPLKTTHHSDYELRAAVPADLIRVPGRLSLTILNESRGVEPLPATRYLEVIESKTPEEVWQPPQLPPETEEKTESTGQGKEGEGAQPAQVLFREIVRMRVVCFHQELNRIFVFEFLDDWQDFPQSSRIFNQILESVRFLT